MRNGVLWILLLASVAVNVWLYGCRKHQPSQTKNETDTVRVTDTVLVRVPVVRDSVVVRTEIVYLERVKEMPDSLTRPQGYVKETSDSLTPVRVPITQRVYSDDSTYTAWVSGYHASLDSIAVYRQMELVTVRQKPRRWTVGLSAGYGITPKGLQPYVGVGVSYRLW